MKDKKKEFFGKFTVTTRTNAPGYEGQKFAQWWGINGEPTPEEVWQWIENYKNEEVEKEKKVVLRNSATEFRDINESAMGAKYTIRYTIRFTL